MSVKRNTKVNGSVLPMIFGQNMKMFSSCSTPFTTTLLVTWPLVSGCCSSTTVLRLDDLDLLVGVGDFLRDLVLEELDTAMAYM